MENKLPSLFHSKRFISIFISAGTVLIVLLCVFLTWNEMKVEEIDISGIPVLSADDGIAVHYDAAYYQTGSPNGQRLNIRGWAVFRGKETRPVSIHVLLRNSVSGKCYSLPTEIKTRSDVTAMFSEDYADYDSSGFVSAPAAHRFDLPHNEYDILILYELKDGTYIFDTQQKLMEKEG